MRWLILLLLSSCGSINLQGLDSFGPTRRMKFKFVNTKLNGLKVDETLYVSYVVNNRKSCFPKKYKPKGQIYTVRYEDHEILMQSLFNNKQQWSYSPHKRFRDTIAAQSFHSQVIPAAFCSIKYSLDMVDNFSQSFVSFVKEE